MIMLFLYFYLLSKLNTMASSGNIMTSKRIKLVSNWLHDYAVINCLMIYDLLFRSYIGWYTLISFDFVSTKEINS